MASIDFHDPKLENGRPHGPKPDPVGILFFLFHLAVSAYIVTGWSVPSASALMLYLAFSPVVAMQWLMNQSSCVINNMETFLRTGRWRDPANPEEGRFVSMILFWLFGVSVRRAHMDFVCYGMLIGLWGLGLAHLSVLGDPALLAIFP